jgi:carboxylate-amine ligase
MRGWTQGRASGSGEASDAALPAWAEWHPSAAYSIGIEEEVMLLDPEDFSLAQCVGEIMPALSPGLQAHTARETHQAAIELASSPHPDAAAAAREMATLRAALARELQSFGKRAASAGTHPFAVWTETEVSRGSRQQLVYDSMRELARREPTFALHIHVGVPDPERAISLQNVLRSHLPLMLAASVNSPFWQGRDSGLASARIPVFMAFPRGGIPRRFDSYAGWAEAVDVLLRSGAFPEPTFLWWDVRPQPKFGTVEVRIMDAQTSTRETGLLAALVQSVARLELEEGFNSESLIDAVEVLDENRFLAARDGLDAELIDPIAEGRVPAAVLLAQLTEAARGHAQDLGCEDALDELMERGQNTGARRQRAAIGGDGDLSRLVEQLSAQFADDTPIVG